VPTRLLAVDMSKTLNNNQMDSRDIQFKSDSYFRWVLGIEMLFWPWLEL
jgi:hypothetical protein